MEYNAGIGAYVPTQKTAEMAVQAVSTIYNELNRDNQEIVWDMAKSIASGKVSTIKLSADLLTMAKNILVDNYPAVRTVNANGVDINTARGMNIDEFFDKHWRNMQWRNSWNDKIDGIVVILNTTKFTTYKEDGTEHYAYDAITGICTQDGNYEYTESINYQNLKNPRLFIARRKSGSSYSYDVGILHDVGEDLLRSIGWTKSFWNMPVYPIPPALTLNDAITLPVGGVMSIAVPFCPPSVHYTYNHMKVTGKAVARKFFSKQTKLPELIPGKEYILEYDEKGRAVQFCLVDGKGSK